VKNFILHPGCIYIYSERERFLKYRRSRCDCSNLILKFWIEWVPLDQNPITADGSFHAKIRQGLKVISSEPHLVCTPSIPQILSLGQRHILQNITLTSYFYKNIYQKLKYVYFYKSILQDKSTYIIFILLNNLKVIHDLCS
jgi:hypothetical protein